MTVPRTAVLLAIGMVAAVLGGYASTRSPAVLTALLGTYVLCRRDPVRGLHLLALAVPFAGRFPGFANPLSVVALTTVLVWLLECADQGLVIPRSRVLALAAAFALVAAASLVPVILPAALALDEPIRGLFQDSLLAGVRSPLYSVQSFYNLLTGLALAAVVATRLTTTGAVRSLQATFLASLAVSVVAGLLDFWGIGSLEWYRRLSAVVQGDPFSHRLYAFFWHPTWCAQYLLLMIPLVFVHAATARGAARAGLASLLAATLLALVFTYQRGGWLSFLAVAALVAAAIRLRPRQSGRSAPAFSPGTVRLAGSLLALALVAVVTYLAWTGHPLWRRARQVTEHLSGRSVLWKNAWTMFLQRPLLGHGLNSFGWVYMVTVPTSSPEYTSTSGTAHSGYFQLLAGCGLLGLAVFALLMIEVFRVGARSVTGEDPDVFWLSLGVTASLAGYMVYGCVQEFAYIQSLEVTFWMLIGMELSLEGCLTASPGRRQGGDRDRPASR